MKRRMKTLMALGLIIVMCSNGTIIAANAQEISVGEERVVEQSENSNILETTPEQVQTEANTQPTAPERVEEPNVQETVSEKVEEESNAQEVAAESVEQEENTGETTTFQATEDNEDTDASEHVTEVSVVNGWSSDKVYYYENGTPVKGIRNIQGVLYYFDNNTGALNRKAQWIEQNGKRYFCNKDGILYQDRFISFGPTYYYMGRDGSVQSGIVKARDGKMYYTNTEGVLQKRAQWIEQGEKRYFCNKDGVLYQDRFISFGPTSYYVGNDGSVQSGIVTAKDGKMYYTNTKGVLQKRAQWINQGGKRYFCNKDGVLYQDRFISFGPTSYYMGNDGSVQSGIVTARDGKMYYTNAEGVRQKRAQWIEQGGKRYFCNKEGVLYRNQLISFGSTYYCMGEDGSVQYGISKAGGKYYYTDTTTGILVRKTGWRGQNGKKYFSKADGSLYQSQLISFGDIYYYCGSDAAIVKSATQAVSGVLYRFDSNGVMIKEGGWGTYNGKRYYKNPATGFPYKNQWVTFGRTWYYANSQGFMVSGWQTINGYRYYFYPNTNQMARNTMIDGIQILDNGTADTVYTYAANVLNQIGWNLRAAYNWSASLKYKNVSNTSAPGSAYFAKYGFQNNCGDCYVMAATFYYMAKVMGYDAHQIDGYVPRIGGGRTPHSWVEINIGGTIYVYDPDFTAELGRNGFQVTYGASGTWRYIDWHRMN